jgi:hypothetical protein
MAVQVGGAAHVDEVCKRGASFASSPAPKPTNGGGGGTMKNELQIATGPKVISPKMHAVLDYGVAGTFIAQGIRYASHHKRAAALAFINGAMILGVSMLTDYPGGLWKKISFKGHGMADVGQAALAGIGPVLMGFSADPEAKFFYGQAASEVGVIAATDWNSRQS